MAKRQLTLFSVLSASKKARDFEDDSTCEEGDQQHEEAIQGHPVR